jgi:hypothetical protein
MLDSYISWPEAALETSPVTLHDNGVTERLSGVRESPDYGVVLAMQPDIGDIQAHPRESFGDDGLEHRRRHPVMRT